MSVRLDLGSGPHPHEGFTGIDLYCGTLYPTSAGPLADAPLAVDLLEFPWPWNDASVDEVWCSHFVEHMPRGSWVPFVDELWRILKPGAVATILHPSVKSVTAFQDPTHQDFIPGERWMYASREWRVTNDLDHPPYPACDFDLVSVETIGYSGPFEALHYWDGAETVQVVMRAIKSGAGSAGDDDGLLRIGREDQHRMIVESL